MLKLFKRYKKNYHHINQYLFADEKQAYASITLEGVDHGVSPKGWRYDCLYGLQ